MRKTVSVDPPREEEESIKSRSRKVLVVEDSKPMQKSWAGLLTVIEN